MPKLLFISEKRNSYGEKIIKGIFKLTRVLRQVIEKQV